MIQNIENPENAPSEEIAREWPALKQMMERLTERGADSQGYVTTSPELKNILNELTNQLPVVILSDARPMEPGARDDFRVEVKFAFTLSKEELGL